MERRGYYSQLVELFEGTRAARDEIVRDLEADQEEKYQTNQDISAKLKELQELRKRNRASRRLRAENKKNLADLEAGGLIAELCLRRLKYASIPVKERARDLRAEFDRSCKLPEEPLSPHASQKLGSSKKINHMAVQAEDLGFEADDGVEIPVRCYIGDPGADVASVPVLLYFHGEGYVLGGLDTHDWICRSLAALARVSVVSVGYRRPPEAVFPTAFEDAYRAVRWVAEGGLGKVPPNICVGGDDSGAGLALACALRARDDDQGPTIDLQVLFYPWIDTRPESTTFEGEDIPFLADLDWYRSVYAPPHVDDGEESNEDNDDPDAEVEPPAHPEINGRPWFEDLRVSPLLASSLKDLPAAFIGYAEDDPLAGESEQLADRLRSEVGHEAVHTLHVAGPLGHGFVKRADTPQAHTMLSAAAAFISAALRAPSSMNKTLKP